MSAEPVPYDALGRPITGPRALPDSWGRFWHLTFNMARTNWKLRFFGSALGYLWQLMRPLMLFGVLYVFFTQIAHIKEVGAAGRFYGAQLLGSIVLFTFFAEITAGSVRSLVEKENIVRKIQFPRLAIPIAIVLEALFNLALNLVVVLVFALAAGVRPMASWLELPLIILLLGALATGFAMLLSAMFIYFRDIAPIWEVVSQILFYASPVIVPLSTVKAHLSSTLLHVYMLNPIAVALQQFRHAMINHGALSVGQALGSQARILGPVAITAAILALGFIVFNRTAPLAAENL
jgi:ABC-2 type transport system permease protein